MNEYLVPSLLGRASLYGSNAHVPVSSRIVATLTMHLREELLEQVLVEAAGRFPYFSVKVAVADGDYVFSASDAFDETLLKVTMCDRTIWFDFHRSLADSTGMMSFVKAVLFRYLEISGCKVTNDGSVKTLSSSSLAAEAQDPMITLEDKQASRPVWYMDAKAVKICGCTSDFQKVVQVRIPLSRIPREYDLMSKEPETFLIPLISHSVYETYSGNVAAGEYVVASVQVDLRPYFPSPSLRPYHTPVYLAYNRNIGEYPYRTVQMSQKKLLEAQLKSDALVYSAQKQTAELEKALSKSDLDERKRDVEAMMAKASEKATYEVYRMGNVMMPDSMQRYVTELYPVMPCGAYACAVTLVAYRGEIFVTFAGGHALRSMADRFVSLLEDNDIQAFVADEYAFVPLKSIE